MKIIQTHSKFNGEGIFIVFLFVFSLVMFLHAFTIVGLSSATDSVGPSLMPKIIFGCMTALSFLLILDYRSRRKILTSTASEETSEERRVSGKRGLISVFGILSFVFLMDKLGFLLSSILYLYFEIFMLGPKEKRRPLLWAAMTIAFCVLAYYLFRYKVYVKLPKGILG